ncbi:MAG: RluA family pseudouridine synthase, partial [Flammeovirgaceae bacterium]|nr:RluA family pseudouridine synthase [Flammeovirgaceae bacterium]
MFLEEEERLYEEIKIIADAGQGLLRIDKFLMLKLPNVSRSKLQEAIREGMVLVNGKVVSPNHRIHPKDEIVVMMPEKDHVTEVIPEDIPLHIVYEDDELLVINKEAGMVVHPGHGNWTGTLVNALAFHFKNLPTTRNGEMKPGLVHRIDKDTSGLLVIAKTEKTMTHLAKQFFDHTAERTYYALVWGLIDRDNGTIEGNIGRSLKDRRMSAVFPEGDHGKPAITHVRVLMRLRHHALVEAQPETGRTHQIRVHLALVGYPLLADPL